MCLLMAMTMLLQQDIMGLGVDRFTASLNHAPGLTIRLEKVLTNASHFMLSRMLSFNAGTCRK